MSTSYQFYERILKSGTRKFRTDALNAELSELSFLEFEI